MTERPYTPLLDQVHEPADLNSFSDAELRQLAEELAKIKSDKALVPIDRDPVPDAFEELVRRYYLRLGKGE